MHVTRKGDKCRTRPAGPQQTESHAYVSKGNLGINSIVLVAVSVFKIWSSNTICGMYTMDCAIAQIDEKLKFNLCKN